MIIFLSLFVVIYRERETEREREREREEGRRGGERESQAGRLHAVSTEPMRGSNLRTARS